MLSLLIGYARWLQRGWLSSFGLTFGLALFAGLALVGCEQSSQTTEPSKTENVSSVVEQAPSQQEASHHEFGQDEQSADVATTRTAQASRVREVSPSMTTQPITILALGDSLTEGFGLPEQDAYPAQLEAALSKAGFAHVEVINAGVAGETTTGLVNRLDWVLKTNPDITILTTGANDAMRGIELSVVAENIHFAIKRIQSHDSEVILSGMQVYDNLGEAYVREFAQLYPQLAEESTVAFIPFFLQGVGGNAALNQADRIHPNKEGYAVIIQHNILPVLKPMLEALQENRINHDNTNANKEAINSGDK